MKSDYIFSPKVGTETRRLNRKLKHKLKRKGRIDFRTNRPGKRK